MSHLVSVDVEFKDLDALRQAAESIGLEFKEGQTTHRWYGEWVGDTKPPEWLPRERYGKCDHAIGIAPGTNFDTVENELPYEIGVHDMGDGTYRLVVDSWMQGYGLMQVAGENLSKLAGEYALCVAERRCTELGWIHERRGERLVAYHPSGGELLISQTGEVDACGFQGVGCKEAVEAVAGAIGSETDRHVKQEFNVQQQALRRTEQ